VLLEEREMDGGKPHGRTVRYYPGGGVESEAFYSDGHLTGVLTTWYESGQRRQAREFRNGYAHGVTREWDEGGTLREETNWRAGKPHGRSVRWHANGLVEFEAVYDDGQLVRLERWDEEGNPIPIEGRPPGS
jgi:antitoxin component YwqK of YwqJK toxin-antitoxin module